MSQSKLTQPTPPGRFGFSYRGLILALLVLLFVPAIAWSVSKWSWTSGEDGGPMMHLVERGDFVHDVTERGNVESASNVEIVSKVKSASGGSYSGTTILEVVPEGTIIKPEDCLPEETVVTYQDLQRLEAYEEKLSSAGKTAGEPDDSVESDDSGEPDHGSALDADAELDDADEPEETGIPPEVLQTKLVLVKLDSSSLENQLLQQKIVCANSKAAVIQAQSIMDVAEIARNEYLEGTHQEDLMQMDIQIQEADVELSQAKQYLGFSERLERKGYITKQQLQDDKTRVMKAENALKLAKKQKEVLQQFNLDKMDKQLTADILTAKAKYSAEEASHLLDKEKLRLIEEQIAHCTIYAAAPGQVVYANSEGHRGQGEIVIEPGTMIRENQVIIRLPDPTRMQVKAKINEARIALVKAGMKATIQLDAFPDVELIGEVEEVSDYAAPTSWFRGDVKEYETIIKILDSPASPLEGSNPSQSKAAQVKTGMTAQLKIRAEYLPDVVQVPVQAIIEHGEEHYCAFYDEKGFRAHKVTIGSTNDKFVVIEAGLVAGQEVVLNAAAYREKLGLPELPPDSQSEPNRYNEPDEEGLSPRGGPGTQGGGEKPAKQPNPAEAFKKMDNNGDGKLDESELPPQLKSGMSAADTNGNGSIELAEFMAIISRFRTQNPGQRAGEGGGKGGGAGRGEDGRADGNARPGGNR